ncbi:DUF4861 domain-containing protein [Bacteroides sp. 51]|uniref:DUF4861 domain-containing protein n=1 Tax=Bacteroides sp. 51 TaxID=2302938 RepID=UPI0013D5862D|nr:DUF4861 domain-containing protein [Bacteroides sp. 51]NDV80666.1 DUF4861 domain-containing protein [Bacteroides sp. 51]
MKKILFILMTAFVMTACNESKTVTVTVTNDMALDRANEMVEVSMDEVSTLLQLPNDGQIIINDAEGTEIPYQITFDEKIIFQANVPAGKSAVYTIKTGTPADVPVVACGRHYPERVDDIAWENDVVAFRTYGPALQANGERAFGYDVWTKYNTTEPVVEARYAMELNPETLAKIDSLKKVDPKAAQELRAATSYHNDHGNGLDCYKVGPTLGGGTAALMVDGQIVYPYCYKTYEILDNGPLRFTLQLQYNPLTVKDNANVIETRVISLDAGSYLNKAIVSYSGLTEPVQIAAGLVLHEPDGTAVIAADAANGYTTYVDPTDNATAGNGKIFVGVAVPGTVKEAKAVYFSQEEREKERGGADGHVLAISDYEPGSDYIYYFGSAWEKAAIKDAASWDKYVSEYAQKVRNPLTVTVK